MTLAVVGWLCIAPVAALVPRRREWLAVIGRDDGKFLDNAKYFYLQAAPLMRAGERCTYLTERPDVADMLRGAGHDVLVYPCWPAIWFLMRAGVLVVDSIEWHQRLRRFLTIGCRRVQLWHGVGFKRIELDKWKNEAAGRGWVSWPILQAIRAAKRRFIGRIVRYDLVNTTSEFYLQHVFKGAFLSRHFSVFGYPRNAVSALTAGSATTWLNADADVARRVREWIDGGRRMVLVAPTFRDSRATPMGLTAEAVALLDHWCETHRVELVFKFHPLERRASDVRGAHLHLCAPHSDLYPLMPLASALVTDYSSIYMDYLLVDRPILFLVPDLNEYIRTDRQLQFDFNAMTPGPRVSSWRALIEQIQAQWGSDDFAQERTKLRRMAFDDIPQEQATVRLLAFMRDRGWLPSAENGAVSPQPQRTA